MMMMEAAASRNTIITAAANNASPRARQTGPVDYSTVLIFHFLLW